MGKYLIFVALMILSNLIWLAFSSVTSQANSSIHNPAGGETQTVVYTRLLSISFIEDASAWLVPLHGRNLLYTNDGGQQWRNVPSEAVNGFGYISFINKLQGWTIGPDGRVWKTLDGGRQWVPLTKLKPHGGNGFAARQLQFVNESYGWAIETSGHLWRTVDGGKRWEASSPSGGFDLERLYLSTSQIGWLGCDKGILLRTTDGGENWETSKVNRNEGVYDLWFANDKIGWALIGNSVYRSLDSGQTWKAMFRNEAAFESPIILSIYFLNEQNGWAVGHSNAWAGSVTSPSEIKGVIFHTDDGGQTWSGIKTNISDKVFSQVYFADQKYGWLISSDNIYRTNDGGQSWKIVLKIPSLHR